MKITLDMIRQAKGLTMNQVAEGCGLSLDVVEQAHRNFGDATISVGKKLIQFYKIPEGLVDLE